MKKWYQLQRKPQKKTVAIGALTAEFVALLKADVSNYSLAQWLAENGGNNPQEDQAILHAVMVGGFEAGYRERLDALAEYMTGDFRRLTALEGQAARAIGAKDVKALQKVFVTIDEAGLIPEDWEKHDGDLLSILRWFSEAFHRFEESTRHRDAGETTLQRAALVHACRAVHACRDHFTPASSKKFAVLKNEVEILCKHLDGKRASLGD